MTVLMLRLVNRINIKHLKNNAILSFEKSPSWIEWLKMTLIKTIDIVHFKYIKLITSTEPALLF